MAGFPLSAIGAGLGQWAEYQQRQQTANMQRAYAALAMRKEQQLEQQQNEEKQALAAAWGGMLPTGGFSPAGRSSDPLGLSGPGAMIGRPQPPAMPAPQPDLGLGPNGGFPESGNPPTAPSMFGTRPFMPRPATGEPVPGLDDAPGQANDALSGGGGNAGSQGHPALRQLVALGVAPEVAQGAVEYMRRNESGLDPGAVNPTSGATGIAQWLGPRKAALTSAYGPRSTTEQQSEFMGSELTGAEGQTLAALRNAKTAKEGYDIWGASFERPGQAALAKAGVGSIALPVAEAAKTAIQTRQSADPMMAGRMSTAQLAQQIEQANPSAPPAVKMMALQFASKLLAPEQQMELRLLIQQNSEQLRIELAEFQAKMASQRGQDVGWSEPFKSEQGWFQTNKRTGETRPVNLPTDATKMPTAGQAAKTAPLDPAQAKFWGGVVKSGGTLPPGLRRSGVVEQIMKEVGSSGMEPGDFIAKHSGVAADTGSLRNMTKMADAAISFENLAIKNLDVALSLAPEAVPSDLGPFFNRWVMEGEKMLGDPAVPAYAAAMITAANEYAKVMSGSTGTAASTVDSRREAREMFSTYFSQPQIKDVVAVAKADMKNRENTLNEQVAAIKGRLGSTEPAPKAPPAMPQRGNAAPAAAAPPKQGTVQDGYRFKGGDPADQKNWEKVQ